MAREYTSPYRLEKLKLKGDNAAGAAVLYSACSAQSQAGGSPPPWCRRGRAASALPGAGAAAGPSPSNGGRRAVMAAGGGVAAGGGILPRHLLAKVRQREVALGLWGCRPCSSATQHYPTPYKSRVHDKGTQAAALCLKSCRKVQQSKQQQKEPASP